MPNDYSSHVRRLSAQYAASPQMPREHDVVRAGVVVERLFPPADAHESLCVLAGLNLLNASLKQPWGSRFVTYTYVKGMAARMMIHVLDHHIQGVRVYWDEAADVAYFRAEGVQVSFHHIPMYGVLRDLLFLYKPEPQQWEGIELQRISVGLFQMVCGSWWVEPRTPDEEQRVRRVMMEYHRPPRGEMTGVGHDYGPRCERMPPFSEDKWRSLTTALNFHIWGASCFTLWRRRDERPMRVVRYTGTNYRCLMHILLRPGDRIYRRPEQTLEVGKLYYVSPQKQVSSVSPSRYILSLTQNSYMFTPEGYCNLCVTYSVARYLGLLHRGLRFVCTLQYNRLLDQHRYYTAVDLYHVPLTSELRWLKVWVVVDTGHLLDGFDPSTLPQWIIDDYMTADDHWRDYEVLVGPDGRVGLRGYRRLELLPTEYQEIRVRSFHAYVKGDNGLWAVYALLEERFRTDFVYERVWYDDYLGAIMGRIEGVDTIIYRFRLMRPHEGRGEADATADDGQGQ